MENKKVHVRTLFSLQKKGNSMFCLPKEAPRGMPSLTSAPMWIRPISLSLLFFISLIGNLSTLCEIKAENQCLVSNNFQTNLFHLFSPFFPSLSFSRSFSLPPPNANRGSHVMTSLSLLSSSNNALKNRERKRNVTGRGRKKRCRRKKRARNG